MERDTPLWRHLFAFLVTIAAAYGVLRLSQSQPPVEPPKQPVMHIRMAEPLPPPPAAPQVPVKQIPAKSVAPVPKPKVVTAPAVNEPNPTLAAPLAAPAPTTATATPPAQVTVPGPPAVNASASLEAAYGAMLRTAVEAQKHYPTSKDAMIQQPRGAVSVWITVDRHGALVDAGIDQSHGSLLDRAALQSVHRASYPPFPADLYPGETRHRFVVSLNYTPQ